MVSVGTLGGGKAKLTGIIDIAVMQSLSRKGEISDQVKNYGQIIVDECHHLSAVSFESTTKERDRTVRIGTHSNPSAAEMDSSPLFLCNADRSDILLLDQRVRPMTSLSCLDCCPNQ